MQSTPHALSAELVAILVAVTGSRARVLTTRNGQGLPSGPFGMTHRSLQSGMRSWIEAQTHHPIGYIEQLYTFADRERQLADGSYATVIAVSYLGLTRESAQASASPAASACGLWRDWYHCFPWEDQRDADAIRLLAQQLIPALLHWCSEAPTEQADKRRLRVETAFGLHESGWNEDLILPRYELLWEAGLVQEAAHAKPLAQRTGPAMERDSRRILATGMARLRAKIKYRPVVFELLPDTFTLLQLQQTVEALAGRDLHKQNFRRQVEQQALVQETGAISQGSHGRPAKLYRFRDDVLLERSISGSKLPLSS